MANIKEADGHPYENRTGVFFGGSGGTGLTAAIEYQKLGGTVILGASSERTFKRAQVNIRFAKGNPALVKPLIGSVADTELLHHNIDRVVREQAEEGKPITDILSFAAAGMPFAIQLDQDFLKPMRVILAENPPNKDELLEAKKAELRRQYAVWLPEGKDEAVAVNFQAKIEIINGFLEAYGGKQSLAFIDFNSTFGKEGKGPGFYGNVLTKHQFSLWLQEQADKLASGGIDTAELTAPVIEDTDVGKFLLDKVIPLLKPELAAVMTRTKITKISVFKAMRGFLDMTPEERAGQKRPYERYIVGDCGNISVVEIVPDELKIDSSKFDI